MTDPLLLEQAPALILALHHSLRLTFVALADMYDGRDGPWVDELKDAAVRAVADANTHATMPELQKVADLFGDMRSGLRRA